MREYIGHPSQLYGVQEKRLVGGKADGMRVFEVKNGKGLEFTVSANRCADISYLSFKGNNLSYIASCGMVSEKYYDNVGTSFLKSFTAGFITTCGLTAAGSPCTDAGEKLPLHGNISNTPAESVCFDTDDESITIKAIIRDASLFSHKLVIKREYKCSLVENVLTLTDTIVNEGNETVPFMLLYHCNMGYPLLSERSVLSIPSVEVLPRDEHAAEGIGEWQEIIKPQDGFVEQCYYHKFDKTVEISLRNPDIGCELLMSYDPKELDCFTQWKMMGKGEYVLGLEPGNCYPDGRAAMRKSGLLKFLKPGEAQTKKLRFEFKSDSSRL